MRMRHTTVCGHYLGSAPAVPCRDASISESSFALSSLSFVSPHSGNVWAKSEVREGERAYPYFVLTKPGVGEGHRESYGPSGSLLSAGRWILDQLSPSCLCLELVIHCDWAQSRPTNLEEFLCNYDSTKLTKPGSL